MKKIIISLFIGISIFLSSCEDLNIAPKSNIVASEFFETEADAKAAVNAVYSVLTKAPENTPLYGDQILYLTDLTSDYMITGAHSNSPDTRAIAYVTYDANNYEIERTWVQLYDGINRANFAIDNIPDIAATDEVKNGFINEAKFLRALYYFNAVQFWGDIPLIAGTKYEQSDLNRKPVADVYDQIIADLKDAQSLPAVQAEKGRATAGAATALLSRVYLVKSSLPGANTTEDLKKAKEYANAVTGYSLVENYYDNFDPAKKNGPEHIFSAQFTIGQSQPGYAGNAIAHCTWSSGFSNSTTPVLIVTEPTLFYDIFSDQDQRKQGSYAKRLFKPATGTELASVFEFDIPRFRKFIDTTVVYNSTLASAINASIIRYADVLFTIAEAENELNHAPTPEAYEALNKIRRRAYKYDVNTVSPVNLSGLTYEEFRDTLRLERYKEFVTEQTRWFDLVRWKILVETVSKVPRKEAVSKRNYLFPIPQAERNKNPDGLPQNWGYSDATISDPYDESYK